MGKFLDLESVVYSIFGSQSWKNENIPTYPLNLVKNDSNKEYIRISIIPGSQSVNINSSSGVLIIDIFTDYNTGTKAYFKIADKLDSYLVNKSFFKNKYALQLGTSSLAPSGQDPETRSLFRAQYTINFNFFGVD